MRIRHRIKTGPTSRFTLVELITVIAMIFVLAGLLLPTLNKARELAISVQCLNNLKQIATQFNLYASNNRDIIPCTMYASGNMCWVQEYGLSTQGQPPIYTVCPPQRPPPAFRYAKYTYGMKTSVWGNSPMDKNCNLFSAYKRETVNGQNAAAVYLNLVKDASSCFFLADSVVIDWKLKYNYFDILKYAVC